ncbi:cytochrome P450 [Coprinopsis cinerea okayama7|uniref:Cytochrome P450 n=1 Tax=Coprinopsis cinerea (strain Okayama-7 / 130 / ATCC MYA-4618 / FGSC 9003) TaxID=240176 RepID=A8NI97_COPC7|nr:cytochrome P450 [Coprinopsis cinerea okayama7\|eukprot:XP_001833944.2 cytochrome P450 [Coprinopsis cinerea okayama7\
MTFFNDLMTVVHHPNLLPIALGAAVLGWLVYQWVLFTIATRKVRSIPTVGSDGFIMSYFSAWRYEFGIGRQMIQEGYDKYPGGVFKVPTLSSPNRWLIVVSGAKLVDDIRKAGKDELSFSDAGFELFQSDHLVQGPGKSVNNRDTTYHIGVVQGPLTKGYPHLFEEIRDEIAQSYNDLIPPTEGRNPEYRSIQENLTVHLVVAGTFLGLLPPFLRPLVGRLITKFPASNSLVQKHITPLVEEVTKINQIYGPKSEKRPNNLISWLMDAAPEQCRTMADIAGRVILINIAAIHTTSLALNDTLFELAARQEYIVPLRAEVEQAIEEYGWTKEAMTRMYKLDSFIKESCRVNGLLAVSMVRNARTDYHLSNGTVIPAGFRVVTAADPTHHDPLIYEDPNSFKGFRFCGPNGNDESANRLRNQLVSLDLNYMLFGNGRSACPGRFFAVNELKAMLAHLLINYDFKLPNDETEPPAPIWIGHHRVPNQTAGIMFKERITKKQ